MDKSTVEGNRPLGDLVAEVMARHPIRSWKVSELCKATKEADPSRFRGVGDDTIRKYVYRGLAFLKRSGKVVHAGRWKGWRLSAQMLPVTLFTNVLEEAGVALRGKEASSVGIVVGSRNPFGPDSGRLFLSQVGENQTELIPLANGDRHMAYSIFWRGEPPKSPNKLALVLGGSGTASIRGLGGDPGRVDLATGHATLTFPPDAKYQRGGMVVGFKNLPKEAGPKAEWSKLTKKLLDEDPSFAEDLLAHLLSEVIWRHDCLIVAAPLKTGILPDGGLSIKLGL